MISLYIGITLGTFGKLILGIAVLRVHAHIIREHKIDSDVISAMKRERYITIFGIFCILVGYILEMMFYANTTLLS